MLTYIFFLTFFLICTIGLGFQFKKFFLLTNIVSIGELSILGLFVISFFVTFFHFFVPISDLLNIFILIIGLFFFFINLKKINSLFKAEKKILIFLIIISILLFFNYKPNEDFGLYHLPYVINFKSEKIIFGLSNLQINQGWNSLWLNLHSFFSFRFNAYKTIYILNIIFYISVNLIFLKNIFNTNVYKYERQNNLQLLIKYFSIFFLCYFNIKFSRLNSYGIDVPSNFLLILSLIYFFKTLYLDNKQTNNLKFLFIFTLFAFMCRISNVFFVILPIYLTFRFKLFSLILNSKFFIFIILFSSAWITQQFIYTGCLVFPYKLFCFIEPSWYNSNFFEDFKNATFYVNKSFSSYSGDLSFEEYHSFLNWVPNWFVRTKIEIMEYLVAFLVPVFFIIMKKKTKIKDLSNIFFKDQCFTILILIIFVSILIWFINSPVIRMGNHFIFLLIFFLLFIVLNYFGQLRFELDQKSIYFLIFLTFMFQCLKNINRIEVKFVDENFFPQNQYVEYESVKKINKNINLNKVKEGKTIQSRVCWDVPSLCTTSDNFDVKSLNSYIFIEKK